MSDSKSLAHIEVTEALRLRFKQTIREHNGCWLWREEANKGRYRQIKMNGEHVLIHRLAYLIHKGDPGELDVLHSCDQPMCVNPDHLFLGTQETNNKDCASKYRTSGRPRKAYSEETISNLLHDALHGMTKPRLAKKYNMSLRTVYSILARNK